MEDGLSCVAAVEEEGLNWQEDASPFSFYSLPILPVMAACPIHN